MRRRSDLPDLIIGFHEFVDLLNSIGSLPLVKITVSDQHEHDKTVKHGPTVRAHHAGDVFYPFVFNEFGALGPQALDLLEIMNFPTSFDKIAVAAASHEALMNKEAFSMILHLFEDYHDRLNLCHMLKLPDDMAVGETVKPTPEKK